MEVLFPALLCLATGFVLVVLGWPRGTAITSDFLLKGSLAAGYGLGIFSCSFFLWLVLGLSRAGLIAIDVGVLAGLLLAFGWTRRRNLFPSAMKSSELASASALGWVGKLPAWGFGVALLASLYAAAKSLIASPHGTGWDAFAIWNLHARFLFRGGQQWKDGFSAVLPWSHPDYPLLLPASIAHFWKYMGRDSLAVPAVIAFIFTFSTVGLLFSALSRLRGRQQGFLAGLVLLGTPYFLERGVSQYADTPLSFFFLATLALLSLQESLAQPRYSLLGLAGVSAGFAAWNKNEGLLFVAVVVVSRCLALKQSEKWGTCWRRMVPFLVGLFPLLLVIAYFKTYVAGPGDLASAPIVIIQKLTDLSRYRQILRFFAEELYTFGHWALIPGPIVAAGYALLLGTRVDPKQQTNMLTSILTIGLMAAGYFVIYLITPRILIWHLTHSLSRLLVQLLPSAVFTFFMIVRTPEQIAWKNREA